MIKKFNNYIKEQLNRSDLDPYGEEDWDDENLSPILFEIKKQGLPYEQIIELDISYKNLTNLEGIENLSNLQILYCDYNQLTSLEGIENLINLQILYCDYNQLTSLEGIENLSNLETLSCRNNRLTNLEGIENLINLKILYCYNNNFSNEYKEYLRNYCKNKRIYLVI
jgi:Leucine-rich repeat (LRR) protein